MIGALLTEVRAVRCGLDGGKKYKGKGVPGHEGLEARTGGRGGGSGGLRGQAPWDHLKKAPNARRQPHQQPAQCWETWAAARVEGLCGTPDLFPRKL